MKTKLLNELSCPVCRKSPLELRRDNKNDKLVCVSCNSSFHIKNDIPYLFVKTLGKNKVKKHKKEEIDRFSKLDCSENSILVNRPHCYGTVENFLFYYTLNICRNFLGNVKGKRIIDVCCGGGADAEYLHNLGARITGVDISADYLKCALVRAKKFNLDINLVVGDAENLPFKSDYFDYGIIHCGLHHLPNPYDGIKELIRVSKKGIVIVESFNSIFTKLFIKLGISNETEAGHPIYRFDKKTLINFLKENGLEKYNLKTFFIYTREEPLRIYSFLDNKYLFKVFKFVYKFVNSNGIFGNRFVLVAHK
jgi:ubiquinone/menaquinone biosynthesis C-methylase UbiE/uncharacterized protein YbaR (Trm112 family)